MSLLKPIVTPDLEDKEVVITPKVEQPVNTNLASFVPVAVVSFVKTPLFKYSVGALVLLVLAYYFHKHKK
ncbi:MAG: hypothetical protein WEA58_03955 [Balneolaceae bacterium]